MMSTIRSQMDEIEVINILKQYSDKKAERMIKSPAFLFNAAIWSCISHSWPGLNYMWKPKYKAFRNGEIYYD